MEKIGTIIRNHRISQGMTQEELGSKVFVSKQAVSKWETGRTLPDIETVRKLCEVLKINKDEILGGSMEETRKSRRWSKILAVVCVVSFLAALFFVLGGLDYIDHHTQAGVAYVSVFRDGELLTTDGYTLSSNLNFRNFENGFKADIAYGEIRGVISLGDGCYIEFGFVNTNNWHNVHIRLDIEEGNGILTATQTISYETDDDVYRVIVSKAAATGKELTVFRDGL